MWIGLSRIDFLTDPATALPTLAVIGAWQLIGQTTILFLAGLSTVPSDLYDAAALDGMAAGWDRFVRVTFPMLGPTTLFVVVTTTITAFQAFDAVAALTHGVPAGSTETLLYKIYLEAYQYTNMGYASALSVLFLAFIAALSLFQIFVAERRCIIHERARFRQTLGESSRSERRPRDPRRHHAAAVRLDAASPSRGHRPKSSATRSACRTASASSWRISAARSLRSPWRASS